MKKVLPDLGELEVEAEGHHTWEVDNWGSLPKRTSGDVFEVGGAPWYVLS